MSHKQRCHSPRDHRRGCSSPCLRSLSPQVMVWIGFNHEVCDAQPVRRQTYGYLPSFGPSLPFQYRTKLCCLLTGTGVRERPVQGCNRKCSGWDLNPPPLDHESDVHHEAIELCLNSKNLKLCSKSSHVTPLNYQLISHSNTFITTLDKHRTCQITSVTLEH